MRFYACCIETRDVKRVPMALKRPRRVFSFNPLNFHLIALLLASDEDDNSICKRI
jgi:hypothetical protein